MPQAADTAVFAVSEGFAPRETLFGTGAERLTPVFWSIADTVGEFTAGRQTAILIGHTILRLPPRGVSVSMKPRAVPDVPKLTTGAARGAHQAFGPVRDEISRGRRRAGGGHRSCRRSDPDDVACKAKTVGRRRSGPHPRDRRGRR